MTVPDAETLELLHDEPELLAIADSIAATQRRRRVPRRLLVAVAAVLIAAAVALAAPWQDDDGAGSLIAERALAALPERGPVLHGVLEFRFATQVNLKTGRSRPVPLRIESWYDEERELLRTRAWRQGQLLGDTTSRDAGDSFEAAIVQGFAKAADVTRKALVDGRARVIGEDRVRGHEVYWIAATSPEDDNGFDVAVDRDTYELVQTRGRGSERADETLTVLTFEYLPRREGVFGTPRPGVGSGLTAGAGALITPTTLAEARDALGQEPAVWAGPAVEERSLGGVDSLEVQIDSGPNAGTRGKALELIYGARGTWPPDPDSVSITQASLGDPGREYVSEREPLPPEGFVELQSSTGGTQKKQFTRWSGQLRRGGLVVNVVGPSRALVIEVARSLREIPARAG
jgi:hypothetical protein